MRPRSRSWGEAIRHCVVIIVEPAFFDRVVRGSFSQRRKTILNSLGAHFGRDVVRAALALAGIDSGARAEALSLSDYRAAASAIAESIAD